MKKLILGGLAALAILGLVGCGQASAQPQPSASVCNELQASYGLVLPGSPQPGTEAYVALWMQYEDSGMSSDDATELIDQSIIKYCPSWLAVARGEEPIR